MRKNSSFSSFSLQVNVDSNGQCTTAGPSNANSQGGAALIGQVIAVIGIVAVFAVIAYAGYKVVKYKVVKNKVVKNKVVKNWSGSQPD
jgi:hypothetical protein